MYISPATPFSEARIGWAVDGTVTGTVRSVTATQRLLRPEPSLTKRGSLRPWPGNVPGPDVCGNQEAVRLSVVQLRRLGAKALTVWRYLVDARGYGARLLHVSLARVSVVTGIPQRSLERAVARLWAAGALDRWVTRDRTDHGWVSTLYVEVYGGIDLVRGQERIWMPGLVATWADKAPSWGGKRGVKLAVQTNSDPPTASTCLPGSAGLPGQVGGPKILSLSSGDLTCSSTKNRGTPSVPRLPVGQQNMIKASQPHPVRPDNKAIPRVALKAATLVGDPKQPETGPAWVRLLVQAYNHAGETHFPKFRPLYPPGCAEEKFSSWSPTTGTVSASKVPGWRADDTAITRWRVKTGGKFGGPARPVYAELFAAARWLAEKGIAPQTWAEHVISESAAHARAHNKTPRPLAITAVFSESVLADPKRRAMFYQAVGPQGGTAAQPTRGNYEQMYRLQEAARLRRDVVHLFGFPRWYSAIRAQEIAQGITDPMELYPRLAPAPQGGL